MKFLRNTLHLILFFLCLLPACNKKQYICPAYNSYFIHDQKIRDSRFSPFIADSTNEEYDLQAAFQDSSNIANESQNENGITGQNTGKFQPKLPYISIKKAQPNGLLAASNGKNKVRAVEEIEMKIIMVKPYSKYSNVDSSSLKKTDTQIEPITGDTL